MADSVVLFLTSSTIGLFIASYLIGSIPMGWLLVRIFYKKDLHKYGSGNVGASNVMTTTHNYLLTAICVIFDFSKGALCMLIAREIGLPIYVQMIAGLGAIIGHDYSIFLKFSGGRGILTTLGVYFFISPWLALLALLVAAVFVPWHHLALGCVAGALSVLAAVSIFPETFGLVGMEDLASVSTGVSLTVILIFIRRLIARRTQLSQNEPLWRIVLCRLFFDRDIPNREAWIHQDRN